MDFSRRTFLIQAMAGLTAVALSPGKVIAASLQSAGAQHINAYRAKYGLPPVNADHTLAAVADRQCRLMIANGRIGHAFGRGTTLGERLRAAGDRPRLAAENVAQGQGSLAAVMEAWMNSSGHRRNMLHPRMREFGIAQRTARGQPYWALVLGG